MTDYTTPAPCNPRTPLMGCTTCSRHSPGIPHQVEFRGGDSLVLDVAAVLAEGSACPLYQARELPKLWWNKEES